MAHQLVGDGALRGPTEGKDEGWRKPLPSKDSPPIWTSAQMTIGLQSASGGLRGCWIVARGQSRRCRHEELGRALEILGLLSPKTLAYSAKVKSSCGCCALFVRVFRVPE